MTFVQPPVNATPATGAPVVDGAASVHFDLPRQAVSLLELEW